MTRTEMRLRTIKDFILREAQKKMDKATMDISEFTEESFRQRFEIVFRTVLRENRDILLNPDERRQIFDDLLSYFLGLGPIDALLKDEEITEIMINGPKNVYVERRGNLELTDLTFKDDEEVTYFVDKMLVHMGRRATQLEPYVDTMLTDGSRVNIVKSPVSLMGPIVTIRKFPSHTFSAGELVASGTLNEAIMEFLRACVLARINLLISGGAGVGKTTLLNILASFIPDNERTIVIEDTPEIKTTGKHTVFLVTRPASIERRGEITIRDLVRNSLHMRPNRIIIGETRSDEVIDMIQAMNTGHDGSMTTLHSSSPADALDRLELLALMGRSNISSEVVRKMILNNIMLIIQMGRLADGSRRIINISEVIKSKDYPIEDIFIFDEISGVFKNTGKIPEFYPKLKKNAGYICKEFEG